MICMGGARHLHRSVEDRENGCVYPQCLIVLRWREMGRISNVIQSNGRS